MFAFEIHDMVCIVRERTRDKGVGEGETPACMII